LIVDINSLLGSDIQVETNPNPSVDRGFSKKIPRVGSAPSVKKISAAAVTS